jgi:hypothetical protein
LKDGHGGRASICKNSKLEARNPKQARILKIQMTKTGGLQFGKFEFWNCFEFRYSDFGFDLVRRTHI